MSENGEGDRWKPLNAQGVIGKLIDASCLVGDSMLIHSPFTVVMHGQGPQFVSTKGIAYMDLKMYGFWFIVYRFLKTECLIWRVHLQSGPVVVGNGRSLETCCQVCLFTWLNLTLMSCACSNGNSNGLMLMEKGVLEKLPFFFTNTQAVPLFSLFIITT